MDVEIAGVGKNADIHNGPCKLTLKSRGPKDEEFLRALNAGLTFGASVEDGVILIDRLRPIFEGAGWKQPRTLSADELR